MLDTIKAKRLAEKMKIIYGKSIQLKDILYGFTPPSNLVTLINYPKVSLGILFSEIENIEYYDNPIFLASEEKDIEKIIEYRSSLINARKITDVYFPKKNIKLYDEILNASLSIKSVSLEVKLKKISEAKFIPKILSFYGFNGKLENLKIVENPKIPRKVESVNDMRAEEAICFLYKNGFSDYYLARLFSLGFFGLKINKRLVASKWAITAVQSIIEKKLIKEVILSSKKIDKYIVYNYKFYGNDFYGIFFSGNGRSELIEAILPGSAYSINNKLIIGKDVESGGYYSLKLSFAEYMKSMNLIGDLIVFRIITDEYKFPLGVWVVREGIKKMFLNKIGIFDKLNEAILFLNSMIQKKYGLNIFKLLKYSNIFGQKKITCYLTRNRALL